MICLATRAVHHPSGVTLGMNRVRMRGAAKSKDLGRKPASARYGTCPMTDKWGYACSRLRPLSDIQRRPLRSARGQAVRVCALRPSLAGDHRDSPRMTSSTPASACHRQGNREWGLRSHTRTPCPTTTEAFVRAGHRGCRQGGGGARGRRPHSRLPWRGHGTPRVDAATVAARGGRPRAWAGERGYRRRPATMPVARKADQRRPQRAASQPRLSRAGSPPSSAPRSRTAPRNPFRGHGRRRPHHRRAARRRRRRRSC